MLISYVNAQELVARPAGMDPVETTAVLDLLMDGSLSPEHGATLLVDWAQRQETGLELAAVVTALLARAVSIPSSTRCMDPVGTGGSGLTRYNISTTTAFILAAAGVPVAKHGNRGSARPNGSFDFLDALGIPFLLPPAAIARLLEETSVCFLFARTLHPAVAAVAPYRKIAAAKVKRTIFNLAGPLANPCRPIRQLLGVADIRTAEVVTAAMLALDTERTVVVCGHPGLDEVSIVGPTQVWDVRQGTVSHRVLDSTLGYPLTHAELPGGDAPVNAELFHRLLAGTETGPLLDMLLINAGAALDCWADRPIHGQGTGRDQAHSLLVSGQVKKIFEKHQTLARQLQAPG